MGYRLLRDGTRRAAVPVRARALLRRDLVRGGHGDAGAGAGPAGATKGRGGAPRWCRCTCGRSSPACRRPDRELVGFVKVGVEAGQRETVEVELGAAAFRYWDVDAHGWRSDPGRYEVLVGTSSRDIRASTEVMWGATARAEETEALVLQGAKARPFFSRARGCRTSRSCIFPGDGPHDHAAGISARCRRCGWALQRGTPRPVPRSGPRPSVPDPEHGRWVHCPEAGRGRPAAGLP